VPFAARAERLDTQVPLLRKLWTERSLTDSGPFHNIVEAGINPLPLQRPIPIWIGGNSLRAIKRAARIGDGWLPYLPAEQAAERIAVFREETARAGRDPDGVPVESIVFFAAFRTPRRTVDAVVADAVCLQKAGAAGIGVDTMNMGLRGADQHLSLLRRVKDMLVVPPNNPIVR
jgi:alkanesulfonate monooxygenase SsuD/methylene tetrahydromethanopterin reductase-like flavin-dependent oxidoreductase (luciferase family)